MADVLFVCVRDDLTKAEALADAMDAAGLSISDERIDDEAIAGCGVVLAVLSRAALNTSSFRRAVECAVSADKLIVASLIGETPLGAPARTFDLSAWDGENDAAFAALISAVGRMAKLARSGAKTRARGQVIDLTERRYVADLPTVRDKDEENEPQRLHWDAAWFAALPAGLVSSRDAR